MILKEIDKIILEQLQTGIPLVEKPFKVIAELCHITEKELLQKIKKLISNQFIRDISALIDANSIGYKNTLVAVKSPEEMIEQIAATINAHPGVSHNYLRDHDFNIWFTLSVPEDIDIEKEILRLLKDFNNITFHILPAIRTFKLDVHFKFTGGTTVKNHKESVKRIEEELTYPDKKIIRELQKQFPLTMEPWKEIATRLKISTDQLFDSIMKLKQSGVIKRIAAVIRHRNAGYIANAMICFKIPEIDIESAGLTAATFHEVTHCYQRPTFPDWPYSLFCMVHARTNEDTEKTGRELSEKINCSSYRLIYSIKEFKKERVKYF